MNLHEWGDEKDCFTKEDLTTLYGYLHVLVLAFELIQPSMRRKHTMKDTESRSRVIKKAEDSDGMVSAVTSVNVR